MTDKKVYFHPDNVRTVAVKGYRRTGTAARSEPRTEIGREALRNFTIDFDALNRAFTKAMRSNG